MSLFVLQDVTDLEILRGLCNEIVTACSHDVSHAISIKTVEFSDAEEVDDPVPISVPGIKDVPEVSCVSVPMCLCYASFTNTQLIFCTMHLINFERCRGEVYKRAVLS
jgi:hypothetical protein